VWRTSWLSLLLLLLLYYLSHRHEYCMSVEDFLARRTRLAFLDAKVAAAAVPRVSWRANARACVGRLYTFLPC
jgi:glycerol-3-phosphate dehydrogenase